jgi:hypothetical protein
MNNHESAAVRKANLHFRRELQEHECAHAWNDYNTQSEATNQLTAKLRAERLAREVKIHSTAIAPKPKKKTISKPRTAVAA